MDAISPNWRFEDFYRAEYPQVMKATLLMVGDVDRALDATQEAFTRAFARWFRLKNHPWAGGWVMTTALNICRKAPRSPDMRFLPLSTVDVLTSPSVDRVAVQSALRKLAPRRREAAILYYWGDLSTAAIAELMGLSEGAVRAHLSFARNELRKHLEVVDAG